MIRYLTTSKLPSNMKLDIQEVIALNNRIREINLTPIDEIDWHDNGKPVTFPQTVLDEWKYIGLSNTQFIDTGYYKENDQHLRNL